MERLIEAYYGELYGISFFQVFKDHYYQQQNNDNDDYHRRIVSLWNHLIEIERNVAKIIYDYITHNYNQNHDQGNLSFLSNDNIQKQRKIMEMKGIHDAKKWIDMDFNTLTVTLRDWVRPYELKYREWKEDEVVDHTDNDEIIDKEQYNNVWEIIVDHETTLLNCWENECKGQSGLPLLQDFLMRRFGISID